MNKWQWNNDGPEWFTVIFPGEEEVKHPVRLNANSGLYEVATDLTRRTVIPFSTKEEAEAHLNDWRTRHMPVFQSIKAGDSVTYNVQGMYCRFGGWKYNRSGAFKIIERSCAEHGTVDLIREKPGMPMVKQAFVHWQPEGRPERYGFVLLGVLVPADTPQNPVSYDAYMAHAARCDLLGPRGHN